MCPVPQIYCLSSSLQDILDDFISRIIVTRGLQKLSPEAEIIYF